ISTATVGTTTYTFTSTDACATTASISVTITAQVTPTFALIGPLCQNSIAPPLPGTSLNNFTGSWSPATISTATVGTTTYTFTSTDACATTASISVTISSQPAAPVLTAVQPTCALPTGTITVTAVAGLEYQLDNGSFGPYPAGGWSGLAPGSHIVTVRNPANNTCTSNASVTINAVPNAPAAPVLTAVQPTCALPTGTITLTPVAGLEYQLDNGSFGPYPAGGWSGLAPGSHTVTVRNPADNSCTSNASVTINAVPNAPAAPALTAVQPTCALPTGTITLTPVAGLEYQLDNGSWGPYPASGWNALAPGSHTIPVTN